MTITRGSRKPAGPRRPIPPPIARQLRDFFDRNGYIRWQAPSRLDEGRQRYKKGDELRLVANSAAELKVIRGLLRSAGFHPGRPFVKGRQYRQPLYSREAVSRFLGLIGRAGDVAGGATPGSAARRTDSRAPAGARTRPAPRRAVRG